MSLVIAVKEAGKVIMAFDSAETAGDTRCLINDEERFKVLTFGDVLVGSVGSVGNIRALVDHAEWFDHKDEEFDKRFIVKNIIPKLFETLASRDMFDEEVKDYPRNTATHIIAYKDRIYKIYNDLSVLECRSVAVAGFTATLVYPYINGIKEGEAESRMIEAMRVSTKLASSIDAPYYVIDTETFKYKEVGA